MIETWFAHAALWLGFAVLAAILARHLRVSTALMEIVVGMLAAAILARLWGAAAVPNQSEWMRFLAASGSVLLTFLAGAELEPESMRNKLREVWVVGLVGFFAPFLGCAALARWVLGWDPRASWLAGIALSTTSMAVVYSVLLEAGLNRTEFGKGILGACFINDLGTVVALGAIFAPFTHRTIIMMVLSALVITLLPRLSRTITRRYGYRTAAIRTKWIVFILFGLGALALWAGVEAVLPAYVAGMVLAEFANGDAHFMRRLRTLTVGFLTPFYFLRAGSLVSLPAVVSAPVVLLLLFGGKVVSKIFGLYPVIAQFRRERQERWYYTLLMSTGLTFGTISALYGLTHGIVTQEQYSLLVATVIASAVIPTLIAGWTCMPAHLLAPPEVLEEDSEPPSEE
jgi:Kef-type K+ transport system membrane component KefB